MENIKSPVETLVDDVKEYIGINAELYKLQAAEKSAQLVSSFVINLTMIGIVCFILFFAGIALSIRLGTLFGELYLGFLAVAGIFVLTGVVVLATKEIWLRTKVMDSFITSLFSEKK